MNRGIVLYAALDCIYNITEETKQEQALRMKHFVDFAWVHQKHIIYF